MIAEQKTLVRLKEELKKEGALSIINVVNYLIAHAYDCRASDIHITPTNGGLRVRLRIDGVLQDSLLMSKEIHSEVISRIKVIAGLRTDEHQTAQDGRFRTSVADGANIDIRVSISPTYYGENSVLRLLSDKAAHFSLEALGFNKIDEKKIVDAIHKPFGMILATGPTGSGKTTTLYTIIKMLNTKDVSIVTIEDPIEYAISDITQIQVNQRTGLTFAGGLRSVLRQDPNIIMVGEIRDHETAGIAVNTALTGHLLLSTIHTNDAATTVPRLLDMNIESFLVASTVNIAIGQRLVRRICDKCKKEKKPSAAEIKSLSEAFPMKKSFQNVLFYHGEGCDDCAGSGYSGRIGINEVMVVDNALREAMLRKASAAELKKIAVQNGMTTMLEDSLEKALNGVTTVEEVLRVIHE